MSTDLITEIQAQPRAFADKLETMRTALEAVTAQLAAVTEDRNTIERAAKRIVKMHTRPDGTIGADTSIDEAALMDLRAAMRGDTAPAGRE